MAVFPSFRVTATWHRRARDAGRRAGRGRRCSEDAAASLAAAAASLADIKGSKKARLAQTCSGFDSLPPAYWNNAAVWHFWHNTSGIPHGENLVGYRIKMREDALKGNTWCDADPPLSNRWDLEGEAGPEPKVWRCKLDPGLKAPAFKSSS